MVTFTQKTRRFKNYFPFSAHVKKNYHHNRILGFVCCRFSEMIEYFNTKEINWYGIGDLDLTLYNINAVFVMGRLAKSVKRSSDPKLTKLMFLKFVRGKKIKLRMCCEGKVDKCGKKGNL